jgi:diaminohydroxyphosphoribosylaminopyrimidine deaminase/5-amino-6-(5-phosphoribosylamino)uracil reductase
MNARWNAADGRFMAEALSLAWQGQGWVEPNPMVGCVLVRGGRIVGSGFHRRFGGPHAEVEAIRIAKGRAAGATAYVTLEPCCHFGKTPPCTDALIAAGVRRVVAAMRDPNPIVSGRGFKRLRAAGIRCDVGLLKALAAAQNAPFVTHHSQWRPYVILKWAQSIDGKIATRRGDSKWITSRASRVAAHELRGRVDAIVVGVNTVIGDDPGLTCRHVRRRRTAARIILDSRLRISRTAKVVRTARDAPTIIATARQSQSSAKAAVLRRAACEILPLPVNQRGIRLGPLLSALRDRGMTNVLVEGGGHVLGAFVEERLADEARIFVAPNLIGGEAAPSALRNIGPATMKELPSVEQVTTLHIGRELCYTLRFR